MSNFFKNISVKKMIPYLLIGAVSSVLHYALKVDSLPLTRITDAVFAGCMLPYILAVAFKKMDKPKFTWQEPALTGCLFFIASMILTVVYFI